MQAYLSSKNLQMQEWGVINSTLHYKATEKQVIAVPKREPDISVVFPCLWHKLI